ncbi:MAG: insulinase family protein [Puniceicoccales bacterium]|nr:insulinase family protein [Puniceicoccales bacterium]
MFLATASGFSMDALRFEWSDDVPVDGKARCGRLENGLHYFVVPHGEPPSMVSVRLIVATGSLMESERQLGLAHFLEHIAFCGSENFSKGDLVEILQRMGMKFGSHSNAYTSFAETVYKLELPDCSRQTIKDGLLVLHDFLGALSLEQSEIDRERGVILSELRYVDSPRYRDAVERFRFLFPHGTLGYRFPIGEKPHIESFGSDAMREFYEKFYVPSNAALVVMGDFNCDDIERLIRFLFGDLPAGEAPASCDVGHLAVAGTRFKLHKDPELAQMRVSIYCCLPISNCEDCRELRREKILQNLGNSILTRRLEIISKRPDAPIVEGEAEASMPLRNSLRTAEIHATAEPGKVSEALKLVEQELRRALDYGFTDGEAERARQEMAALYRNARLQEGTLRSSRLANIWCNAICSGSAPTSAAWDDDFAASVLEHATAHRIHEAFAALWSPKNRSIYVSGNLPETLTENAVRGSYMRSQKNILAPPPKDEDKKFAYTDFGEKGDVVSRSEDGELGLRMVQFANGVRLNAKKTDFEEGQVHLRIRFGRGLLSQPNDMPGLARFSEMAFSDCGLGKHSAEELRDLLAGHIVSANFSVGNGSFDLDGRTTAEDLPMQLRLMAAYLSDPGFRGEGEMVAKRYVPQLYVELNRTADGALLRHGDRFLHCGDSRFGYPEPDLLMAYGTDDLKNWLGDELRKGYVEISAVGDFDPNCLENAVAETFGALAKRTGQPAMLHVPMGLPRGQSVNLTYDSSIRKGLVHVYWPTDDTWDVTQKRHLDMLASLLGDRIRLRLRKELGDAYSPHAFHVASAVFDHYGYICASAQVDEDRVDEIADMVLAIGDELKKNGPSEDEFVRVQRPTLTEIRELLRKNSYWLGAIDGCQAYADKLEFIRTVLPFYENVKVGDLTPALRFLSKSDAMVIKVRPEKK